MRPTIRIKIRRLRLWRGAAVLAAAALGCAGLTAVAAAPASAAPVCQVTYTVNSDWGTGFSVAINITNNGPAITSWTLGYAYTGNQKIAQGWSGNWSQSGENITVTNASWNGTLATGGSASIGANFSYTGTNTAPAAFTLNGSTCNGTGSPSPTPTSPSPIPDSPSAGVSSHPLLVTCTVRAASNAPAATTAVPPTIRRVPKRAARVCEASEASRKPAPVTRATKPAAKGNVDAHGLTRGYPADDRKDRCRLGRILDLRRCCAGGGEPARTAGSPLVS